MPTSSKHFPFWLGSLALSAYLESWQGCFLVAVLYCCYTLFDRWCLSEEPLPQNEVEVCIVGAGFAGIAMAIKCKKLGVKYFVVESSNEVGGVWRENIYPGCGSDIESILYSYSFEPNADGWTKVYPDQPEILEYLKKVASKYEIRINFNTALKSAVWHPEDQKYELTFGDGSTKKVNFLVSGAGPTSKPVVPEFKGQQQFRGPSFHSAHWDKRVSVKDKRVAVIGNGASAVQIVPAICKSANSVHVFQRTANWVSPKFNLPAPKFIRMLFTHIPGLIPLSRLIIILTREALNIVLFRSNSIFVKPITLLAKVLLRLQVWDSELVAKLTPNFAMGCKRITPSDGYLFSFNRSNVKLVTSPIETVQEEGIHTQDGEVHQVDVIVYATGFSTIQSYVNSFSVKTKGGRTLNQILGNEPKSYLGVMYPELPNYFTLIGPNSFSAYTSVVWTLECQVNYIGELIRFMTQSGNSKVTVRARAMKQFQKMLNEYMENKPYAAGCVSWYRGNGDRSNFVIWPSHLLHYWWLTRKVDPNDYNFE